MIKIQLDVQALEKLFPEGTPAYFHFQTAVISEAAKKFTKGIAEPQLRAILRDIVNEVVKEQVSQINKQLGGTALLTGYYQQKPELTTSFKESIRDQVHTWGAGMVKEECIKYTAFISSEVQAVLRREISVQVKTAVTQEIDRQLGDGLKEKIKNELGKLLG